jgi:hypothetical protein
MTTIVAPHGVDHKSAKFENVVAEMRRLGAPTLRGVDDGSGLVLLIEGSHRLAACKLLGVTPVIEVIERDETVAHDAVDDLPEQATAGQVADHFGDGFARDRNRATILTVEE